MNGRRTIDWVPIDPELRKIYTELQRGALQQLSNRVGISATTLSQRARRSLGVMGINHPKKVFNKFTPREDEVLIQNYPSPAWQLQKMLSAHGRSRTISSVINRLYALRKAGQIADVADAIEDSDCLTTADLAEVMGVTQRRIQYWVTQKQLTVMEDKGPDDSRVHRYRIHRKPLRDFLMMYPGHWDSKACDHFWLVDILTAPSLAAPMRVHRQDSCGTR